MKKRSKEEDLDFDALEETQRENELTQQEKYVKKQYAEYCKNNPHKKLTKNQIVALDTHYRNKLQSELRFLANQDIRTYMIFHKNKEVKKLFKENEERIKKYKQNPTNKKNPDIQPQVDLVNGLRWKPVGRSDFRRIEPEMILITDTFDIRETDILGNQSFQKYDSSDPWDKHWNILRVFISSSRHDSTIGRTLRYLVRDKVSKGYLGIICIGSALMNLTERNNLLFGKTKEEIRKNWKNCFNNPDKSQHSRQLHMANGQTLMSCQPFGRSFNGGKLLALLAVSDQVQRDWKKQFGQTLVTVETTSLYGEKNESQYDGLRPYWYECGQTEGEKEVLLTDDTYKELLEKWMKLRHHYDWFKFTKAKNQKNQPVVREKKQQILKYLYKNLRVESGGYKLLERNLLNHESFENYSLSTKTGHKRGVYLCQLYENADLFLQGKIKESQLKKSFPTDNETLIQLWKYGYEGDTLRDGVTDEIKKLQKMILNPKKKPFEKFLSAKSRINSLVRGSENREPETMIPLVSDWYEDMRDLSLKESLKRYKNFVGA